MAQNPSNNFVFIESLGAFVYYFDINPNTLDLPVYPEPNTIQPLDGAPIFHDIKDKDYVGSLRWDSLLADRTDIIENICNLVGYSGLLAPPNNYKLSDIFYYNVTFLDKTIELVNKFGQVRYSIELLVNINSITYKA